MLSKRSNIFLGICTFIPSTIHRFYLFLGDTEFLVKCMLKCAEDEFDPETNTNGRINLGTAVNALVEDLIEDRLNQV